jgi:cytochrome bd-type quinol oxidase subunit 2
MPGLGELVVICVILLMTGIWIWMLFDCIRYETDKVVWLLILIFLGVIGALVYLFARRNRRNRATA